MRIEATFAKPPVNGANIYMTSDEASILVTLLDYCHERWSDSQRSLPHGLHPIVTKQYIFTLMAALKQAGIEGWTNA